MTHTPYQRIIPGARTAVLFVHGILSTPRFWDDFVAAIPAEVSVHSLLLPGHGGSVTDFGRAPWGAWRQHVRQSLNALSDTHERVIVVAHSLGTALTINLLSGGEVRADRLLLIAPPLRIRVKPGAMLHNMLKGVGLAESPDELATYYGTSQDWRVWRYIGWIPRYLELFCECAAARKAMPAMTVPARVFLSPQDELVSMRTAHIVEQCPAAQLTPLPDSHHHDFGADDKALMIRTLLEMLDAD